MNYMEKEVKLTIRVPDHFNENHAHDIFSMFADKLQLMGCDLIAASDFVDPDHSVEFVFDDELCVQDEKCECVDGYLMATDSLVERMEREILDDLPLKARLTFSEPNFYAVYNLNEGSMEVTGTYWYHDGEDKKGEFQLPLTVKERENLCAIMDSYCEERYHMSCLAFVNEARMHEGLPVLEPLTTPGKEQPHLSETERVSLDSMLRNITAKGSNTSKYSTEKEPPYLLNR